MLLMNQTYGFNDKKEGFILGISVGYHGTEINQKKCFY